MGLGQQLRNLLGGGRRQDDHGEGHGGRRSEGGGLLGRLIGGGRQAGRHGEGYRDGGPFGRSERHGGGQRRGGHHD